MRRRVATAPAPSCLAHSLSFSPLHSVVACEDLGEGLCHGHASLAHERLAIAALSVGHLFTGCLAAPSRVLPVAKSEDARGLFDTGLDYRPSHVVSAARETLRGRPLLASPTGTSYGSAIVLASASQPDPVAAIGGPLSSERRRGRSEIT